MLKWTLAAFNSFLLAVPSFAQSYCVKAETASLRSYPSNRAKVSWKVQKFMPLQGTGKVRNGFIEVLDFQGENHWVRSKDVTTHLKCLVVKAKTAPLRQGPGLEFNPASVEIVHRYMAFQDKGGEDGWTIVELPNGEQGWIDLSKTWKPRSRLRMSFENEVGK